jgi:4-hydroxy-tetrahydrodipicolinate synthase
MKNERIADGVWPVMLTPFKGRDQIDFKGLEQLTDWYINQGVHGLFSACLSSETLQMRDDTKLSLVKHVIAYADGRIPVIAGVMGVDSRAKRVDMINEILEAGAAAAVLTLCDIAPQVASDKQWIEEMDKHLAVLQGVPLGVYECPWPYHRMLTSELTKYVTQHSEFLFLKETSGNLAEMERKTRMGTDSGLKVFSADAPSILEALRRGLNGFSGLQTNLWPALFVKLFECWQDDPDMADRLQQFFADYNWVVGRSHSYPASAKLYLKTACGLNIESMSFLNDAAVGAKDQEWIDELIWAVSEFTKEIDLLDDLPKNDVLVTA